MATKEGEVNVLVLSREYEESVCRVWVSVEPEYKHRKVYAP